MPFFWSKKREAPKDAATSSLETPSPSHQPQTSSYPKSSNTMAMGDAVNYEELYEQERKGLQYSFKGKEERIKEQFVKFWEHKNAQQDVDAYLKNDEKHTYTSGILKWVQGSTPFTNNTPDTQRRWRDQIFAENEDAMIVGNYASFDIAQYPKSPQTAGMSTIHLLGVTKESIFNGVSVTKDKVHIIYDLIKLFQTEWGKEEPNFREKVLQHQRLAIDRAYNLARETAKKAGEPTTEEAKKPTTEKEVQQLMAEAERGRDLALTHWERLKEDIHEVKVEDFQFGLHLFPDHSISHFHLHIVAMHKDMRLWSTSRHDEKTKDAYEVANFIKTFEPTQVQKTM